MKIRKTHINFSENQNIEVEYMVFHIQQKKFLMIKSQELPDLFNQWGVLRKITAHFTSMDIQFDRIAVRQGNWLEIEIYGTEVRALRDIHGAVPSCSPIEIPYLMIAHAGAKAAYF